MTSKVDDKIEDRPSTVIRFVIRNFKSPSDFPAQITTTTHWLTVRPVFHHHYHTQLPAHHHLKSSVHLPFFGHIMSSDSLPPDFDIYTFLDLTPTANTSQIRKAYRLKSLLYHPDKNPSPTAAK